MYPTMGFGPIVEVLSSSLGIIKFLEIIPFLQINAKPLSGCYLRKALNLETAILAGRTAFAHVIHMMSLKPVTRQVLLRPFFAPVFVFVKNPVPHSRGHRALLIICPPKPYTGECRNHPLQLLKRPQCKPVNKKHWSLPDSISRNSIKRSKHKQDLDSARTGGDPDPHDRQLTHVQ